MGGVLLVVFWLPELCRVSISECVTVLSIRVVDVPMDYHLDPSHFGSLHPQRWTNLVMVQPFILRKPVTAFVWCQPFYNIVQFAPHLQRVHYLSLVIAD